MLPNDIIELYLLFIKAYSSRSRPYLLAGGSILDVGWEFCSLLIIKHLPLLLLNNLLRYDALKIIFINNFNLCKGVCNYGKSSL